MRWKETSRDSFQELANMTRDESCVLDMRDMPAFIHHHEARIRQALAPQRRIRRRHDLVGTPLRH
jgi:hypothetical protein